MSTMNEHLGDESSWLQWLRHDYKASLKNILVADFPAVWVLKPPYGRMEIFYFFFRYLFFYFLFFEYSSKLFPAVFFVPMWTENLCGANLSYYEMCERNGKVWIPFIHWDSQLCMLWLTQTKKITNLKLFDMCMWTNLSTKITNTILNKIKNFPTYLMGFFWAWNPQQEYF